MVRPGTQKWAEDTAWLYHSGGPFTRFLFFCSVEAPPKPVRTSDPQPKRHKKINAPQDIDMEDVGDEGEGCPQ